VANGYGRFGFDRLRRTVAQRRSIRLHNENFGIATPPAAAGVNGRFPNRSERSEATRAGGANVRECSQ